MKIKALMKRILATLLAVMCCLPIAGTAASDFQITDIGGVEHRLSNYRGKWVLVNYWATWCPPCFEEVPDLIHLYENRPKKDVMVIGVVFDYQDLQEVADYINDMVMSYPVALSENVKVQEMQAVTALPTTFIFNPQGKLVKTKRGVVTVEYMESLINSAKR